MSVIFAVDIDNPVVFYFQLGLSLAEILSFLAFMDKIIISRSILKRKLKRLRLYTTEGGILQYTMYSM